jgi:hypothetical protein
MIWLENGKVSLGAPGRYIFYPVNGSSVREDPTSGKSIQPLSIPEQLFLPRLEPYLQFSNDLAQLSVVEFNRR